MDFMAALGGRKNFGFLVSVLTLTVVAVFAPGANFKDLAEAIATVFGLFVGGNAANTIAEMFRKKDLPTTSSEATPPIDLDAVYARIGMVEAIANDANQTATQSGEIAFKINEQLQALKNTIAIALKK